MSMEEQSLSDDDFQMAQDEFGEMSRVENHQPNCNDEYGGYR